MEFDLLSANAELLVGICIAEEVFNECEEHSGEKDHRLGGLETFDRGTSLA